MKYIWKEKIGRVMGIESLLKKIRENFPSVIQTVPLKNLSGYRVAVDMSIYFYQFIRSSEDMWKERMVRFLLSLKKHSITPVCIFDGPNPPKEKILTQMARRKQTNSYVEKLKNCKKHLKYLDSVFSGISELTEEIITEMKKDIGPKRQKTVDWEDPYSIKEKLAIAISTYEKQTAPVEEKQKELAREIIEAMGFPSMVADGEAEGLCSFLSHRNCDAVLTEDSDVLAYGAKIMLFNYNVIDSTVQAIVYDDLLRAMGVSKETFIDLCIFLGCDYNKDSETGKPYKIQGIFPESANKKKTAYGNDKRWKLFINGWVKNFEDMKEYFDNLSNTKYKRIRQIFTEEPDDFVKAPYSIDIDFDRLEALFEKNKIRIRIETIKEVFEKPVFEDE